MKHLTLSRCTLWLCLIVAIGLSACDNNDNNDNNKPPTQKDMTTPDQSGDMASDQSVDMKTDQGPDQSDMKTEVVLTIPGMSAPAQVNFDDKYVLHARCATNDDCFAIQGYYHAAHRFAQMDVRRRNGRGRLSSLLRVRNQAVVDIDVSTRAMMSTRDGQPLEEVLYNGLDAESKGFVDAYTRGVNAWLADARANRNGAKFSEEYDFLIISKEPVPDWEPQDSIAVGLLFLNSLINRSNTEIRAGRDLATLGSDDQGNPSEAGEKLFMDLHLGWHIDPASSIISSAGGTYNQLGPSSLKPTPKPLKLKGLQSQLRQFDSALAKATARLQAVDDFRGKGPFGSNSWATAPAKNNTDYAILSNDPHLQLSNPSVWYLAELDSKSAGSGDYHAAGVSFPGLPGILIGYNDNVAWSATVAFWDLVDVYTETLSADKKGVVFKGQDVPFITKSIEVPVPNAPETFELKFVPHHGPVISMDDAAGTAVTVKSVLPEQTDDLQLFLNIGRAGSLDDAKAVLAKSTAAEFNFTLIDRQGNIAYYPFAALPRREWDTTAFPAWMPLPGTGDYEWSDTLIRANELPQMRNPPKGFIVTANAAITDDMLDGIPGNEGYPPLQTVFMAPGPRQARILDVIESSDAHTAQTHLELQGDTVNWIAQELLPDLLKDLENVTLDAQAKAVYDALTAWQYTCPTGLDGADPKEAGKSTDAVESIGCSAFHVMVYSLAAAVLNDAVSARGIDRNETDELRTLYWLIKDPSKLNLDAATYWDDETTDAAVETRVDIVTQVMATTASHLNTLFGSSMPDDWRWGRIHTVLTQADLLSAVTDDYNNGPYAAPGGVLSVNVANPSGVGAGDGYYGFSHGPSMRMVVEGKSDGFVGQFQLPGGQVHRRDSPYYDHLMADWLINKPFIMPFTTTQVDAASIEKITIKAPE